MLLVLWCINIRLRDSLKQCCSVCAQILPLVWPTLPSASLFIETSLLGTACECHMMCGEYFNANHALSVFVITVGHWTKILLWALHFHSCISQHRVDGKLSVKVADFGLSCDVYRSDYYHLTHRQRLPIRWMPPESIFDSLHTEKSDVVSYYSNSSSRH